MRSLDERGTAAASVGSARARRAAVETQLRELVARVAPGAKIYFPRRRPWRVGHSWNGRHLRPTGLTLESQLHEVAHLLLTPPERLAEPEFGLGPDPYRRNDVPRTVPIEAVDREELHACWMQQLLAHLCGLNETAVCSEFQLPALTAQMVATLAQTYPNALPPGWWERGRQGVRA